MMDRTGSCMRKTKETEINTGEFVWTAKGATALIRESPFLTICWTVLRDTACLTWK